VSAMLVLSADRVQHFLDAKAPARDPGTYLLLHPVPGLGSLRGTFLVSCGLAWLTAHAVFARRSAEPRDRPARMRRRR
jgi:hypothetical protein